MGLLIVGAGGHGRVVRETALSMEISEFQSIAFLDDNNPDAIGKLGEYRTYVKDYQYAFVAIGDPTIREEWIHKLIDAGYLIPSIIAPGAYVAPSSNIGEGSVILPGAIVQANTLIGKGVIISSGAIIDHDATIGDYCHINAGAVVTSGKTVQERVKVDYLQAI